eukprot:CAMPEP_0198263278 /NCGR_PEP_ID=MMETSP1447-20131203/11655_1 /TAXON_ID=420782 /ORGANISM="Chaetoceros dichaeta, Strain CCMP1751" /LENGTH=74 /DNA_ID=CAMNT_0043951815 /DNA_START=181 /DNA_END=402 /DNA_ORIENTATION=-
MTVLKLQDSILTEWKPRVKALQEQCIISSNKNGKDDLKLEIVQLKKRLLLSDVDELQKLEKENFDMKVVVRGLR